MDSSLKMFYFENKLTVDLLTIVLFSEVLSNLEVPVRCVRAFERNVRMQRYTALWTVKQASALG